MSGGDYDGATPAKQHKPNEPVPIFVVGEEIIEDNDEEVQEMVQEPNVIIVQAHHASQSVVGETHEATQAVAEDEQYHTDDSQSIVSDDGQRDVQNVKQILIVSEIDSDDNDNGERESDAGASDNEYEAYGDHDSQIDVDKMKKVMVVSGGDSDDDSFCDGGSENSDDNNGLPPEWQMNCQPGAAPFYYHIPTGAVTNIRPYVPGYKKSHSRTMGYELSEEE
ncbi:clumping factor A-like isoform X2 [Zerene cesonia]|uniref:clumping factor A-like isoform X2 n=1 Tax=Zerene cesonia TaxID=33412 RepID=UPI0018E506A3|nr:clumping factor A-like isoform X2 [Zerene cesonia]